MMSSLRGADDLAQFIAANYSGRVVEVGAGHFADVAQGLQARGLDAVLTDRGLLTTQKLNLSEKNLVLLSV